MNFYNEFLFLIDELCAMRCDGQVHHYPSKYLFIENKIKIEREHLLDELNKMIRFYCLFGFE